MDSGSQHALVAKSYIVVHTVNNKVSHIVGFHEIDLYVCKLLGMIEPPFDGPIIILID